jgi:hypothetical protein
VRFDPKNRKHPVRVWDAIDGDLVERSADDPDLLACEALGLWWRVVTHPEDGPTLRLARDREGRDILPTPDEVAAEAMADAANSREAAAKSREAEEKAHEATERARADAAREREANERLQAELAVLRAKVGPAKAGAGGGKARKKR